MIIYRFKYKDYHLKPKLFRCLPNTPRLYILEILRDEEKTISEIVHETKFNQSNGSNHLNCLLVCCFVNVVGREIAFFIIRIIQIWQNYCKKTIQSYLKL
jgi:hypothetical protein